MAANDQKAVRDGQREDASREELAERIARAVPDDGFAEPLDGLWLRRASEPTRDGARRVRPRLLRDRAGQQGDLAGRRVLPVRPRPLPHRHRRAARGKPHHRGIAGATVPDLLLRLDPALVGSVMVEAGYPVPRGQSSVRAIDVSPLDADLLDAVVRLVRLLDSPTDARVLAPLITREIVYRLLAGEQGDRLRQIATLGGHTHRIAKAIERLRDDFDRPLRIEDLAQELGMSVSGFHHHFKEVTAMSPLEFQKQLRLQEARRLMLGEGFDATSAGYRVGYNDVSHFNREYKRLFGEPPMRDVERLRERS